jgi:hypothetical protein
MTAEEILEKHLLLMLKRTDESYVSVDEMKKQPEWQATINAMLEYSEMQALRIHDVVNRRELTFCGLVSVILPCRHVLRLGSFCLADISIYNLIGKIIAPNRCYTLARLI